MIKHSVQRRINVATRSKGNKVTGGIVIISVTKYIKRLIITRFFSFSFKGAFMCRMQKRQVISVALQKGQGPAATTVLHNMLRMK